MLTMGLMSLAAVSTPTEPEATVVSEDLVWRGSDFAAGALTNVQLADDGLSLVDGAANGQYISPIITSPLPFNVLVPQWIAYASDGMGFQPGGSIELFIRTAAADGSWEPWQQIYFNADWTLPDDTDDVGQMVVVPDMAVHELVQFSVNLYRGYDGASPRLEQFKVTMLDSTQGPTSAEMPREIGAPASPELYPKPPVVPRSSWCTHSDCNYTNGLFYEPVTHLLVHHTVTSNGATNWAAIVRAIWSFHTYDRGWGDIGYNYLVDPNGVIYEGHLGGDDVIGTHAAGANAGSMGVALMGTFTRPDENPPGIVPPAAMQNSLVDILAWKADQKGIDVYSASGMPNLDWGLLNLAGHRDVYGTTTCPGEQAHDLIPSIRARVAQAINWQPTHTYIDELSPAFSKSNANWHVGPYQCGFDVHSWFTYSVTDPGQSTNWAEWRPTIESGGWYEVEVFAPYCNTGEPDTPEAHYEVHHANGVSEVVVNQRDNLGLWVSLGSFQFNTGTSGYIYLSDLTQNDSGSGVWFDAIRLNYIAPAVHNTAPAANSWVLDRTVAFSWAVTNPSAVATTQLQVSTTNNFSDIIYQESWSGAPTNHQHTFGADYVKLFWRVNMTLTSGATINSVMTRFGLDSAPPTSLVVQVVRMSDGDYVLRWEGADVTSGIDHYNLQYRPAGAANWTNLLTNTTITTSRFTPPSPGTSYWFRSQAVDNAGWTEPAHGGDGDISTDGAPLLTPAAFMPIMAQD